MTRFLSILLSLLLAVAVVPAADRVAEVASSILLQHFQRVAFWRSPRIGNGSKLRSVLSGGRYAAPV
ncbi:hypothetical protein H8B09_19530 [Paenibacillus sp. PR3]|uniref:Uncharacterized protein n=1 Tax=Paenibacillus terricola TaxID=2763503 RepID=A0ABR8MYE8_9BACL|nr:hypothetical protein [Paenibacillus terricola]MBD3920967.1 hypothetical protein [Paenibacillus terricola]